MNQKLSWTLLAAGVVLFLYQVGDLVADHSTWSEVASPAGVGEILKTFGGAMLAVFGALGIKIGAQTPADNGNRSSSITGPAAVVLLALALTSTACAGAHSAPLTVNPTAVQVAQTQKDAIRAIEATTTALKVANVAVAAADELNKAKLLPDDVTRTIATAGLAFAKGAQVALTELENVATQPSLVTTTKRLVGLLDPFLKTLDDSKNEKLQAFAASLRIGMSIVRTIGG